MLERLAGWFERRIPLVRVIRDDLTKPEPLGIGWLHCFGSSMLTLLIVQIVTGVMLAWNYSPTPDHAWDSVQYLTYQVPLGGFLRGLHRWSASVLVVVLALHVMRVFFWGAYKFPRETTWVIGACLGLLILGFAFTGYLLPWDQKAYWATTVGTRIAEVTPLVGRWILLLMRGGEELTGVTLARFYGVHVWALPATLMMLLLAHLYLVVRIGISAAPTRGD